MPQTARPTVLIIDDDESVLSALARLLDIAGFDVLIFTSVDALMQHVDWPEKACVIADIRMPGMQSLLLPQALAEKGIHYPVIFLTAQDTEENRAAANKAGGAAFFRKPVDDQALIDSIVWAMRKTSNHADKNRLHNGG